MKTSKLFCFGFGYTSLNLAKSLDSHFWSVFGTSRSVVKTKELKKLGIQVCNFKDVNKFTNGKYLNDATHVLISAPPTKNGDPVLRRYIKTLCSLKNLEWVGYLSSTSVYGHTGGKEASEKFKTKPTNPHGRRRVKAEKDWLHLWSKFDLPVHVFRLAAIYGPGRSVLERLKNGSAQNIIKPGHYFSRIHIDDIVSSLKASMLAPNAGQIYNVCDDEPAVNSDVVCFAAKLMGVKPPPEILFENAQMSQIYRSFYSELRSVCNSKLKNDLNVELRYPNYRLGLSSIFNSVAKLNCQGN